MGYCTYRGQKVPGSRQTCERGEETSWVEEDTDTDVKKGGSFLEAVNLWDEDKPEKFTEYVGRRWKEDPAKLAFDIALWGVPGAMGIKALKGAGKMANILKSTYRKPAVTGQTIKEGTKFTAVPKSVHMQPSKYPINKPVPKYNPNYWAGSGRNIATGAAAKQAAKTPASSLFKNVMGHTVSPYRIGMTAGLGTMGAYGIDRSIYPMTEQAKLASLQGELNTMNASMKGIDETIAKEKTDKEAAEKVVAEQNRLDNMSFFDKFKLGMKDPQTAALFGAHLRDIGSNIPGASQGGKMEMELADANAAMASASAPDAATLNATKVSETTLMKRFMSDKSIFKIGDSKVNREAKAADMVSMYRAVQAQLFAKGMRTDDDYVMQVLRAQAQA